MKRSKSSKSYNKSTTLASLLAVATIVAAAPLSAHAGNGNNGNGRGNDNRSEQGQIASSLRGMNAAHANENAFLNAAPNSMPGQLQTYRTAVTESSDLIKEQNDAAATLIALRSLTEDEIATQYPDGSYEAVLAAAVLDYETATGEATAAEQERTAILAAMTGGRTLSDAEMDALHAMLGF